jgi:hypothetical protein
MAVLRNGSKCTHTTCVLRFFTVSRLALNTNLIFEIGSINVSISLSLQDLILLTLKAKRRRRWNPMKITQKIYII